MRRKLTALLALATTSCIGWRVEPGPAPQAAQQGTRRGTDGVIKLRLNTGEEILLRDPEVVGDSLIGVSHEGRNDFARRAVATKDVRSVLSYGIDGGKTFALVGVSVLAVLSLIALCVATFEV